MFLRAEFTLFRQMKEHDLAEAAEACESIEISEVIYCMPHGVKIFPDMLT